MRDAPRLEPPLDPRWLQLLSERFSDLRGGGARFEDLFIEQRLELRAVFSGGELQIEECRLEGAAARWRSPTRVVLHASTGLSARAIGDLLARHADRVALPQVRPVPAAEMDPPRGWLDWACEIASRLSPAPGVVRYLNRRAAVIRADGWSPVSTPALVRVERGGEHPAALLGVWRHPLLGRWIGELIEKPAGKPWAPDAGIQLPVVFTGGTAGVLMHELVGHMAESDVVTSGGSPLSGLLGATITAAGIKIVDDPTRFDLPGAFNIDDEAMPAVPIAVVKEGRFERYLCDVEGGRLLGCDPGRGRRATWSRSQTVLRIERGWEIRHGRRRRPLASCELTGSVVEILANIDPRIGSDPTPDWRLGWCVKDGVPLPTGSEAPSLLVTRLEVL